MKNFLLSVYGCTFFISLFFSSTLPAQQKIDSTHYYYENIVQIKNGKETLRAFQYFEAKAEQALQKGDTLGATYFMELVALGQYKMGFPYQSEATAIQAYRYLDKLPQDSTTLKPQQRIFNHLGILYRELHDFETALQFYNKALAIKTDEEEKITIVNNIANIYKDQEQYRQAIEVIRVYMEQIQQLKDIAIKATILDNLAYNESKLKLPEALAHMEQALQIRLKLEDLSGIFSSYQHFSEYYRDRAQPRRAQQYAQQAKKISNTIGSPAYQLKALSLLLQADPNVYLQQYERLSDSLTTANLLQRNRYAALLYNVEKEKMQTQQVKLQEQEEKNKKQVFQSLGALIFLASISLFLLLKVKYKKEKLQEIYTTETRISKKVHDEVANDVYHVMTKLQARGTTEEDVLDDLEGIYTKTRDISRESSAIDVSANFEGIVMDLLASYQSEEVTVLTRNAQSIHWNTVSEHKKTTIYRVLQELMTNMKKHSKASYVVVTFQQHHQKISIDYKDNGVGGTLKKYNGLQNAENRIKIMKGTIIFTSEANKGFTSHITL